MPYFVDTSVWYAAADSDDAGHERAAAVLRECSGQLVTTDHIVIELWLLARARLGKRVADQLTSAIPARQAQLEITRAADLEAALEIGRRYADRDFSLTDRTSWAVMLRLGVQDALSLDADYSVFRFGPDGKRAFRVRP